MSGWVGRTDNIRLLIPFSSVSAAFQRVTSRRGTAAQESFALARAEGMAQRVPLPGAATSAAAARSSTESTAAGA